jgi:hypothetical protein
LTTFEDADDDDPARSDCRPLIEQMRENADGKPHLVASPTPRITASASRSS